MVGSVQRLHVSYNNLKWNDWAIFGPNDPKTMETMTSTAENNATVPIEVNKDVVKDKPSLKTMLTWQFIMWPTYLGIIHRRSSELGSQKEEQQQQGRSQEGNHGKGLEVNF